MRIENVTPEEAIESVQHEGTREFLLAYLDLLKKTLEIEEVKGDSYEYSYYTCGQAHDRHNPNWKPFGILEKCCKKSRLIPLAIKEIIEEQLGKKIICECEILSDPKEVKRKRLSAAFGVDFAEPGNVQQSRCCHPCATVFGHILDKLPPADFFSAHYRSSLVRVRVK
jgi:hypothetical protein